MAADYMWLDANADGCLVDASDSALRELGYTRDQLVGRHVWDITPASHGGDAREMWREFSAAGRQSGIFELVRANGSRVVLEYQAVAGENGVNRSILRRVGAPLGSATPDDTCPFERPFDVDFRECNTYDPVPMRQTDALGGALAPQWTCRNLQIGYAGGGRHYARCGIGSAIDRTRRLQALPAQLRMIRKLRAEAVVELAPRLLAIVDALTGPSGARAAREDFLRAFRSWRDRNQAEIAAAGMDPDELTAAVELASAEFLRDPDRRQWDLPVSEAEAFSPPVAAFVRPDVMLHHA